MITDPFAETPTYQRLVRQGREQGLQEGLEQGLEQGLQQGKQEGKQEGLQQGLQTAVLEVIDAKFPTLTPLARQRVPKETKPDVLNLLLKAVIITPDETVARVLLESLAA